MNVTATAVGAAFRFKYVGNYSGMSINGIDVNINQSRALNFRNAITDLQAPTLDVAAVIIQHDLT